MQHTHANLNQPNPINLHLEFLRRTSVGPATFHVRDVKLGSRITNLHLTLTQNDDANTSIVEGYIMMSNINSETGLSLKTAYTLLPPPLPADLRLLATKGEDTHYRRRGPEPFPAFRRAVLNVALYLVKPSSRTPNVPRSTNDQWIRLAPRSNGANALGTGRWTNDALGFLVDMFPQIIEQYINPVVEDASITCDDPEEMRAIVKKLAQAESQQQQENGEEQQPQPRARFWYPTLTLTMNVKKALPDEGVDFLFVRVKAKRIKEGRFDLDVEVWDEGGELVATSYHASLALDSSRNVTRGGKKQKIEKL
jgi:acyl-CoA thioesterase FadM